MSAPNPGRQSPDPETQTGAQQQDPPSAGKAAKEYSSGPDQAQKESDDTKNSKLESNPVHPLEKISEQKFAKGTGN